MVCSVGESSEDEDTDDHESFLASDEETAAPGTCDVFTSGVDLLRRNPDVFKVMLAAGLQGGASCLADTFVLSELKVMYWGEQMSENQAFVSIMLNVVAVGLGGAFGKFSDNVDRRFAASLFAAGTFLPAWTLIVCGQNASGLFWSSVAKVVGSYGLTSNVMFSLLNDVTPAQDREIAAGVFFAMMCFLGVLMTALPVLFILVLEWIPNNPATILWGQVGMSALFFFITSQVNVNHKEEEADTHDHVQHFLDEREEEPEYYVAARRCSSLRSCCRASIAPLRLAFFHRRLRRLCIAAFLLSFAGNLVSDVGGQFFAQSLGLLTHPDPQQVVMMSVYCMIPGQLMAIPANLITGYISRKSGPLKLLRRLVPFAAVLVSVGAFMAVVKQMWFIAVVVICLTYANLPNVPLMRIVAGVAPPGRMGEAMAAVGTCATLANLIGNFFVAFFNPILLASNIPNPLWVYYPSCGLLVLFALLPLSGTPRGGWGTAAGRAVDSFHASIFAKIGGSRWRHFVWKRRADSGRPITPKQSEELQDLMKTRERDALREEENTSGVF